MKCPSCNNAPSTFLYHYLWSHPFNTKCKVCKTKLKPDAIIKKMIYMEILLAFFLGVLIHASLGIFTLSGFVSFAIIIAVVFYPLEKFAWNNGSFTIKN